jgi:hypothetical protein
MKVYLKKRAVSGVYFRNSTNTRAENGGTMIIKLYMVLIILVDFLSLILKVISAIVESIYKTFTGVPEKSVSKEIVLVSVHKVHELKE